MPVVHPLYWREVPDRKQDWADNLKAELKIADRVWRREYELDFSIEPGKPAFQPPFTRKTHVPRIRMVANPGLPLLRGWDYGFHHPACVFAQIAGNGQMLYLDEMMGSDVQLTEFVQQVLKHSAALMGVRAYSAMDFDDPSGMNKKDHGLTSREVLNSYQIWPFGGKKKIPIVESVKLIRENLKIRVDNKPASLVNSQCKTLIRALDGGYTAEEKPDGGVKFRAGSAVHIVDAMRYLNAGIFRLGREPCQRRPFVVPAKRQEWPLRKPTPAFR